MTEKIFLLTLVALALVALNTPKLRRAVIYLGIFSLVSSFVYLLYGAPDVAIAEAVIGSTLATVLYLVALKKYQVFTLYYANDQHLHKIPLIKAEAPILKNLEDFLIKREMEPQIIYSGESFQHILDHEKFDLLIYQSENSILIYGCADDYQFDAIEDYFRENHSDLNVNFMRCKEGEEIEA